jgi:hypothetical protein
MKPSEVLAMADDIGWSRATDLLETRDSYNKDPTKFGEGTIDGDLFKARALDFGYDLKDDSEKLLHIKDKVEQAIAVTQTDKGRKLTREEKDDVTKKMMIEYPKVKTGEREPGTWGYVFRGKDIIDSKKGYQVKDAASIQVDKDAVMGQIEQSFLKRGITPTRQDVLDLYSKYLILQQDKSLNE